MMYLHTYAEALRPPVVKMLFSYRPPPRTLVTAVGEQFPRIKYPGK